MSKRAKIHSLQDAVKPYQQCQCLRCELHRRYAELNSKLPFTKFYETMVRHLVHVQFDGDPQHEFGAYPKATLGQLMACVQLKRDTIHLNNS